jgi:hypothetical protein
LKLRMNSTASIEYVGDVWSDRTLQSYIYGRKVGIVGPGVCRQPYVYPDHNEVLPFETKYHLNRIISRPSQFCA